MDCSIIVPRIIIFGLLCAHSELSGYLIKSVAIWTCVCVCVCVCVLNVLSITTFTYESPKSKYELLVLDRIGASAAAAASCLLSHLLQSAESLQSPQICISEEMKKRR